jgi:hypothetical protein
MRMGRWLPLNSGTNSEGVLMEMRGPNMVIAAYRVEGYKSFSETILGFNNYGRKL